MFCTAATGNVDRMKVLIASKAEAADVEKLASMLDTAAEQKLQVEGMEKEKEAKQDLKEAAEVGHAAAGKLKEEGCEDLAVVVEEVALVRVLAALVALVMVALVALVVALVEEMDLRFNPQAVLVL